MTNPSVVAVAAVVGGVLSIVIFLGMVAVRRHRRRQQEANDQGTSVRDLELQSIADDSGTSSQRVTPPGLELDLDTEDSQSQADLADLAVSKASCHLCGGFFCASSTRCCAADPSNIATDQAAANIVSRIRACRVRGKIFVTAADVRFQRGLNHHQRWRRQACQGAGANREDHSADDLDEDPEASASYFFHRGFSQPAEHQQVERIGSSGSASLAALPGHDYRIWRCPAPHPAKSPLCERCQLLLSFQLTPAMVSGGVGGEILLDQRRSWRRVWVASATFAGPLTGQMHLPLALAAGGGGGGVGGSQTAVIQFGVDLLDDDVDIESGDKGDSAATPDPCSIDALKSLRTPLQSTRQISNNYMHLHSEGVSADADTEPTDNEESGSGGPVDYAKALAAAAAATASAVGAMAAVAASAIGTASSSGDQTISDDCEGASASTITQTEWSSLRRRAAASAASRWAAISMQEVADELESSSSPGVNELSCCQGQTAGVDSSADAAANSLKPDIAPADRQEGAQAGTDAEYLRFLYSSDEASLSDVDGSDGGRTPATSGVPEGTAVLLNMSGTAPTGTSRRSSAEFYTAESNVTSKCDSSQSETAVPDG